MSLMPCPNSTYWPAQEARRDRENDIATSYEERAAEIATDMARETIKDGYEEITAGTFSAASRVYPGGADALHDAMKEYDRFGGAIPRTLMAAFESAHMQDARQQLDTDITEALEAAAEH